MFDIAPGLKSNPLMQSKPESAECRNVLASIANFPREITQRYSNQLKNDAGL